MSDHVEEDKDLTVPYGEEYEYEDESVDEKDEDAMYEDTFTNQQYLEGPIKGLIFASVGYVFAFYKKHSQLTCFGIVNSTSNQKGGEFIRYLTFDCDKNRKSTPKKQSKMIDSKLKLNYLLLLNG